VINKTDQHVDGVATNGVSRLCPSCTICSAIKSFDPCFCIHVSRCMYCIYVYSRQSVAVYIFRCYTRSINSDLFCFSHMSTYQSLTIDLHVKIAARQDRNCQVNSSLRCYNSLLLKYKLANSLSEYLHCRTCHIFYGFDIS